MKKLQSNAGVEGEITLFVISCWEKHICEYQTTFSDRANFFERNEKKIVI